MKERLQHYHELLYVQESEDLLSYINYAGNAISQSFEHRGDLADLMEESDRLARKAVKFAGAIEHFTLLFTRDLKRLRGEL